MNKLVVGILAHVDAGKTTLTESMLYTSGKIQTLGRVDKKDAYLDTHNLERERGITIFAQQAVFELGSTQITLLDTPGHVDFSTEMERTLHVLDYAILVISGADGVQGHTATLWRLLQLYKIPTFLFINKMDQPGTNKNALLRELKNKLADSCIDFTDSSSPSFLEEVALSDEQLMETYLNTGEIEQPALRLAVKERKIFPCFFGSALKIEGVDRLLAALADYTIAPSYPAEFGAEVFKISRDEQGNRLTHLKLVGGGLRVRDSVLGPGWEEKITQIRVYSGEKYKTVSQVGAGAICAVTGLNLTKPGQGLGIGTGSKAPILEPVLAYQIILPSDQDPRQVLPKLREIEEEQPELRIVWDEQLEEIQVQLMGEVQIEILQSLIQSRFGLAVEFDTGKILYKETIANTVEVVGHFEPLRHYAEVHLLLEPGEPGSGLNYAVNCSEDLLAKNYQRLILSHLEEKAHVGVLTGSPLTDVKITLVAGRAHNSHTQGGDFREATYRAVRQGLKEAKSVLLEPYYDFRLEVPEQMIGRAMTDVELMNGTCEITETKAEMTVLTGSAPVVTMRNYQQEVIAYTRGQGRLFCTLAGYRPCHNAQEVIAAIAYDAEKDQENPTGSIFCAGGAGFYVSWDQVKEHMHLDPYLKPKISPGEHRTVRRNYTFSDLEEIDYALLERTVSGNRGEKLSWRKRAQKKKEKHSYKLPQERKDEYLLVDGYNVIHAWPELKQYAAENMDLARGKLLDALASYRGIRNTRIIVVFDAHLVQGQGEQVFDYYNIHVVFTKEAQTADQYIEKFAYDHHKQYDIRVATSDALQQIIIRGAGCRLLSARELLEEVQLAREQSRRIMQPSQPAKAAVQETLSPQLTKQMQAMEKEE